MRGNVEVKRIADGIYEEVVKNIKEFADVRKADIATIAEKNVEEGLEGKNHQYQYPRPCGT